MTNIKFATDSIILMESEKTKQNWILIVGPNVSARMACLENKDVVAKIQPFSIGFATWLKQDGKLVPYAIYGDLRKAFLDTDKAVCDLLGNSQ